VQYGGAGSETQQPLTTHLLKSVVDAHERTRETVLERPSNEAFAWIDAQAAVVLVGDSEAQCLCWQRFEAVPVRSPRLASGL